MGFTDLLKKSFPYLTVAASMVPGGSIATTVLGKILNLKSDATLDDAAIAIMNATPEQRLALQQEENRHEETLKQLGIGSAVEFERIAAGDRDSARNREIQTKDYWTTRILAASFVSMAAYIVFAVMHGHLDVLKDPTSSLTVGTVIGYIFSEVKAIVSYFVGASAGGERSTELLSQAPAIQK